jgi:hypothetical protein
MDPLIYKYDLVEVDRRRNILVYSDQYLVTLIIVSNFYQAILQW